MPLFPRFHYPESTGGVGYSGFFPTDFLRLLEDFDDDNSGGSKTSGSSSSPTSRRAFSPNFDVKETDHDYLLEGEVPGLADKSNISIVSPDDKTILIQGRIERSYHQSSDDQGRIEGDEQQKNITSGDKEQDNKGGEQKNEQKSEQKDTSVQKHHQGQKKPKYWVTERSIGEFSRSFNFPTSIDAENTKAVLEHGLLKVTVPKMEKKTPRKIAIN
jgi:HSP20 family molecular chaperone IbpA